MSASDTPRTDAALPSAVVLRDSVLADLARTLERESVANKEELRRTQEEFRRSEARLAVKTAQAEALAGALEMVASKFGAVRDDLLERAHAYTTIPALGRLAPKEAQQIRAALRQYRGET